MKIYSPVRLAMILLIFTAIWIAFEHVMGWNTIRHDIGQFARLVPALVFWISIFVVVRNEKRKESVLTFRKGWITGIILSVVYSIGFTLIIIIYQQFVNPEFYETLKAFTLQNLQLHQASQEQIDSSMKELEMSFNGSVMSYLLLLIFSLVWGVLLSAIAAMVFKSKKT
jgi:hypothetical protein